MFNQKQRKYWLLLVLLSLLLGFNQVLATKTVQPKQLPPGLHLLNKELLNQYMGRVIQAQAPKIAAAVVNQDLHDLELHQASFDLDSGRVVVKLSALYKGLRFLGIPLSAKATGSIGFTIKTNQDFSQLGVHCTGLTDSFKLSGIWGLFFSGLAKRRVNEVLTGQEFWLNGARPANSQKFNSTNLVVLLNRVLQKNQLQSFEKSLLGGKVQVHFRDLVLKEVALDQGRVVLACRISADTGGYLQRLLQLGELGKVERLDLSLYIDTRDDSWWAKVNQAAITVNGLAGEWNGFLNTLIEQEINRYKGLIPLGDGGI